MLIPPRLRSMKFIAFSKWLTASSNLLAFYYFFFFNFSDVACYLFKETIVVFRSHSVYFRIPRKLTFFSTIIYSYDRRFIIIILSFVYELTCFMKYSNCLAL